MRRAHYTQRAGVGLVVLLGLACAEPPDPEPPRPRTCLDFDELVSDVPDFPVSYATEHLDVHISPDRFLCAGSAIDYERHVQYVASQLGIEIQRRIPVYAMLGAGGYCSSSGACSTYDGVVFATPYSAYHELTHGVACEIGISAPKILAEGLAVSFEPSPNTYPNIHYGSFAQEFSEVKSEFASYYSSSGHFIRWLAEQLGPAAFAELYRTANYEDGVWTAMEAAYGSSLLATDYATESPAMWIQHRQCADMPLLEPNADGGWIFEAKFDCDDESTLGPYEKAEQIETNGSTDMFQSFLIDVPEPGAYVLEREPSSSVIFERCLADNPSTEQEVDDEWVRDHVWFNFQGVGKVNFEHAGLWRVDVLHEYGPPVDVWFTIVPEPG